MSQNQDNTQDKPAKDSLASFAGKSADQLGKIIVSTIGKASDAKRKLGKVAFHLAKQIKGGSKSLNKYCKAKLAVDLRADAQGVYDLVNVLEAIESGAAPKSVTEAVYDSAPVYCLRLFAGFLRPERAPFLNGAAAILVAGGSDCRAKLETLKAKAKEAADDSGLVNPAASAADDSGDDTAAPEPAAAPAAPAPEISESDILSGPFWARACALVEGLNAAQCDHLLKALDSLSSFALERLESLEAGDKPAAKGKGKAKAKPAAAAMAAAA